MATQEESERIAEERWNWVLNSLGKAPVCRIPLKVHRAVFKPKTADINARNALLSLPMDVLVEILKHVGPFTMYNVTLTCKSLTRVVFGHRPLLYPNPSRFEYRSDVLGAGFPGQLPLYVANYSRPRARGRRVRQPRVSAMALATGCYRCCMTKDTPLEQVLWVGSLRWMRHLHAELDLIDTPCTRGIMLFIAMELAIWFGDLIMQKGTLRERSTRTREQQLHETLPRFQIWINELEQNIDNNMRFHTANGKPVLEFWGRGGTV